MQAGSSRSEASDPRDKVAELVTKDVWDRLIFDEASGELDSSERAADATAAGLAVDAEEKRSPQSPPQPLSPLSPPRGVDALQSGGLESALGADPRKRNRAAASMSSVGAPLAPVAASTSEPGSAHHVQPPARVGAPPRCRLPISVMAVPHALCSERRHADPDDCDGRGAHPSPPLPCCPLGCASSPHHVAASRPSHCLPVSRGPHHVAACPPPPSFTALRSPARSPQSSPRWSCRSCSSRGRSAPPRAPRATR